jgi:hypothetical protein
MSVLFGELAEIFVPHLLRTSMSSRRALPFCDDAIDEARLRGLREAVVNFARRKTNYAVIFDEHSTRAVALIRSPTPPW